MPQSTLGGNSPTRHHVDSLTTALKEHTPDYEKAFRILERSDGATSLTDFKEQVVESLGSVLGFRHVSFFSGPTFSALFDDRHPITAGRTAQMLPEYSDRWSHHDVFSTPRSIRLLQTTGVTSIGQLESTGAMTLNGELYVRHFVRSTWQLGDAAALKLELFGHHTGLVGIFTDQQVRIEPRDLMTLQLISRHLSAVARGIPFSARTHDCSDLTPRQREVAHLVAEGFSNAKIARTLRITEDSVKKYVTRILATKGCESRMELALAVRQGPCSQ